MAGKRQALAEKVFPDTLRHNPYRNIQCRAFVRWPLHWHGSPSWFNLKTWQRAGIVIYIHRMVQNCHQPGMPPDHYILLRSEL